MVLKKNDGERMLDPLAVLVPTGKVQQDKELAEQDGTTMRPQSNERHVGSYRPYLGFGIRTSGGLVATTCGAYWTAGGIPRRGAIRVARRVKGSGRFPLRVPFSGRRLGLRATARTANLATWRHRNGPDGRRGSHRHKPFERTARVACIASAGLR